MRRRKPRAKRSTLKNAAPALLNILGWAWHWVRVGIKPDDAAAAIAARARPVCYVLERESRADLAVLRMVCARWHLPRADKACFALIRPKGLFSTRRAARAPRYLVQLIAAAAADPQLDVDLVPVTVFWGRAPHKEASLWRLLFAENWVLVGRFRKFLRVLVNGRNTLVHFGEPLRLRDALEEGMSEPRSVRWVLRNLRAALRAQRAYTLYDLINGKGYENGRKRCPEESRAGAQPASWADASAQTPHPDAHAPTARCVASSLPLTSSLARGLFFYG